MMSPSDWLVEREADGLLVLRCKNIPIFGIIMYLERPARVLRHTMERARHLSFGSFDGSFSIRAA